MNISDIQIWPVNGSNTLKARGRFTLGDAFRINVTVMNGKNGLFVGLPGRWGEDKEGNKKWYSDVFCSDDDVRKSLQEKVLEAYNAKVGDGPSSQGDGAGPDNQDNIPF